MMLEDLHPQDRLLLIEALVHMAGNPRDNSPRQERAWQLAELLAADFPFSASEAIQQIDDDWSGHR